METDDWFKAHLTHGEPEKIYPVKQPPTYRLLEYRCPCGATHLVTEPAERPLENAG